jgi:glycerophosphoryl diester phosphodiesterase
MFPLRRTDPIFEQRTPLLFAHRGGAQEAPESTVMAFEYAVRETRVDVLELDVQLTRDREMVVWHGPGLNNVRIVGADDNPSRRPVDRRKIGHFRWDELAGSAWVADPPPKTDQAYQDLSTVPDESNRLLLRFSDFLEWAQRYPELPMNVELKECFSEADLPAFITTLKGAGESRKIVVASNRNESLLETFRRSTGNRYATNLPAGPLLKAYLLHAPGWLGGTSLIGRAVEAPYARWVTPRRFIEQVRDAGGTTFVFLTSFPLVAALDVLPEPPGYEERLVEILNRGVDGIMTDLPRRVRGIIDKWVRTHP